MALRLGIFVEYLLLLYIHFYEEKLYFFHPDDFTLAKSLY